MADRIFRRLATSLRHDPNPQFRVSTIFFRSGKVRPRLETGRTDPDRRPIIHHRGFEISRALQENPEIVLGIDIS